MRYRRSSSSDSVRGLIQEKEKLEQQKRIIELEREENTRLMQERDRLQQEKQLMEEYIEKEKRRPLNPLSGTLQQQESYLVSFDLPTRNIILESMTGAIPNPLPPISTTTISYYRRSNQHVFLGEENGLTNPHLIYESLWMLTIAKPEDYPNYNQLAEYFEKQLPIYLNCGNAEVSEMAIIVAGEEVCWALSNIAAGTELQSTTLLRRTRLVARLLSLLESDAFQVKIEIMYVLSGLVRYAEPNSITISAFEQRVSVSTALREELLWNHSATNSYDRIKDEENVIVLLDLGYKE
ncbi:unnamed protein product [Sphagnum jensenii]